MAETFPRRTLDGLGRCCGRKPIVYKRPFWRQFCPRCNAAYGPDGKQVENFAWLARGDGFEPMHANQEYVDRARAALAQSAAIAALRQHWASFCDADPVPDGFIETMEAGGLVTFRSVTKDDLDDSFAAERGIGMGGTIWVLTKAGRAALADREP